MRRRRRSRSTGAWARTASPLPDRFAWQPASLRPALLTLVRARLTRADGGWNMAKGAPRRGSAYRTLAGDVLATVRASPVGEVFARHGYRLESTGHVSGVEVGRVAGHGRAMLPTEIADMGLIAVRTH